jgi:sulfur-carrier protein adenylyltransferase/sulfurtransferase
MAAPASITALEAYASRSGYTFVDVREPEEQARGRIDEAVSLPLSVLAQPGCMPELETEKPCVVYCAAGVRSQMAIEILKAKGFHALINMSDGYQGWQSLPRKSPDATSSI